MLIYSDMAVEQPCLWSGDSTLSIIAEKQKQLTQARNDIEHLKLRNLADLVEKKRALSEVWAQVLLTRTRVRLLKQTLEDGRRALKKERDCLSHLEKVNARREERLRRVRRKDLHSKEERVEEMYADCRDMARQQAAELSSKRQRFISQAFVDVFPIEVEPLSSQDAGDEDYTESSSIDCDASLEVDEGWVLEGVHKLPSPHIRIVTASVRSDGDYSLYLIAAKERRKAYSESAQLGVYPPTPHPEPQCDPYLAVPAALAYTAQFVELIADILDQPLPYHLPRHAVISEYGNPGQKKKDFLRSVAKLDDNIMYLCFSQMVPLSALTPGHSLKNLLALVTHTQLGRSGAFECQPELMRYNYGGVELAHGAEDSEEPPSLSYTTDQSLHSCHSDSEEDPSDVEIEKDWEAIEPLPPDEIDKGPWPIESVSATDPESELHRTRLRHLEYNSTYLDYVALGASERSVTSVSLSATDSVKLMESINAEGGGGNESGGGGLFGTLSSLWSSTFSRTS